MRKVLFSVLVAIHGGMAWGDTSKVPASAPPSDAAVSFHQTLENPIFLGTAEIMRRNPRFGLYDEVALRFQSWVAVDDQVTIGLDAEGKLWQSVRLEDRSIAFLLSGKRVLRSFFVSSDGQLFAVDFEGQLLKFRSALWKQGRLARILAQRGLYWLGGQGLIVAVVGLWYGVFDAGRVPEMGEFVSVGATPSAVNALVHAYRAVLSWEAANGETDGFIPISAERFVVHRFDRVWNESGDVGDYELRNGAERRSLVNWIGALGLAQDVADDHLLTWTCQYHLIPKGYKSPL